MEPNFCDFQSSALSTRANYLHERPTENIIAAKEWNAGENNSTIFPGLSSFDISSLHF